MLGMLYCIESIAQKWKGSEHSAPRNYFLKCQEICKSLSVKQVQQLQNSGQKGRENEGEGDTKCDVK